MGPGLGSGSLGASAIGASSSGKGMWGVDHGAASGPGPVLSLPSDSGVYKETGLGPEWEGHTWLDGGHAALDEWGAVSGSGMGRAGGGMKIPGP